MGTFFHVGVGAVLLWLPLMVACSAPAPARPPWLDSDTAPPQAGAAAQTAAPSALDAADALADASVAATAPLAPRPTSGSTRLPCDVSQVLTHRCLGCHGAKPLASVPMAMVSWEDIQAPAVTRPELAVYQLAAERIHDAERPMPPNVPLPAEELALLDAYFAAAAPASDNEICAVDTLAQQPPGAELGPPPGSTCYTLKAHGLPMAGDDSPYVVRNEHYACFYYDMPWPAGSQGVYFASAFDEHASSVHHWIVYLDENGVQPDGYAEACSSLHPSAPTMVAGWAPGSDNNDLPPDVGMHLSPASGKLLLEFHFFHDGLSPAIETTSGVTICTADQPRPHTATISMLGTEAISLAPGAPGSASGICTPAASEDIHILRSWPHMHQLGRELETTIMRADGSREALGRWSFDFNSQVSHPSPAVVHPGDRLETTCFYENTSAVFVGVGQDTQSEMCFNFVTAYPAAALASRNLLGGSTSATGSATACLQ
ncbi:MAG: hypothetical protein OEZ06_13045 [Myxococcales bacterium]|nr:hypothetical protein [Myxococcales bacterium]